MNAKDENLYWISYSNEGVLISRERPDAPDDFRTCYSSAEISGFEAQLNDEGYSTEAPHGTLIPWEALYDLIDDHSYAGSLHLLHLPPASGMTFHLVSHGGLANTDFRIKIKGALDEKRRPVLLTNRRGGVIQSAGELHLLSQPVWRLAQMIAAFRNRTGSAQQKIPTARMGQNSSRSRPSES